MSQFDSLLNQIFYTGPQTEVVGPASRAEHMDIEKPSLERALRRKARMEELAEQEKWAARGLPVPPDAPYIRGNGPRETFGQQVVEVSKSLPSSWSAGRTMDTIWDEAENEARVMRRLFGMR